MQQKDFRFSSMLLTSKYTTKTIQHSPSENPGYTPMNWPPFHKSETNEQTDAKLVMFANLPIDLNSVAIIYIEKLPQ
jgi:hypothetical protein